MRLNERDQLILNELFNDPSTTSMILEQKYQLSRRQLGYSIDKINKYLLDHNLPVIERTRKAHFIIDRTIFEKFNVANESKKQKEDEVLFTEEQRLNMIISLLILSTEELSLNHFTSYLKVSKNTVLSDLKLVQKQLEEEYGLIIRYSRKSGYVIEGKEFQIRKLLIHIISMMWNVHVGERRLKEMAGVNDQQLLKFSKRVEKVENKLNLKFTDEKIKMMPMILIFILKRIEKGNIIDSFSINYEELSNTKEYQATEEILYDYPKIPETERLFITLHLLTTNVVSSDDILEDRIPNLLPAIDRMLRKFEKRACIYFEDREQLLDKLLQHIKPAYYRIKYHLTDKIYMQGTLQDEMKEMHHLVKQSTKPLESLIGIEIPEHETIYITMLIGGWMKKQGESIERKVKAVVVCPQGISVSKLMYNEMVELFPEFIFLDNLSVREFLNYPLEYDVVFSPTYLETNKKLFVTKVVLGKEEKNRLRKQVMLTVHSYVPTDIDENELMRIISNYAEIKNEKALKKELKRYIHRDMNTTVVNSRKADHVIQLNELLVPETITLLDIVDSWESAIRICAKPLVEGKKVEPRYVDAMIRNSLQDSYIVIGPNIAIPHAAPEDGVNQVGMSLLCLKQSVPYGNSKMNLIVVIATKDKQEHIHALMQLMKLAGSREDREQLVKATSIKVVSKIIDNYSGD
ncbi:BglG family transcription antiterminator [Heyndrickxia oleronia]|uniref:Ascorbate-specific PTS system EIIA component n=1 Tax=Heyndrickxia oleronia TaxID=38875 RepID=A0A8E2IAT5_9BACI|nr:BglG family transcription antiterminator [Heyndrickxia oleronia]MEC1375914.1 BglG family transcription antiterminator [Heyndrickxia oleronia]OOP69462.1 transcription antiterminator BglG [Heyndrickxia oleronia]QQZ05625.1 BglG family transcription antiterminator [Heyndrickxia oleronia]